MGRTHRSALPALRLTPQVAAWRSLSSASSSSSSSSKSAAAAANKVVEYVDPNYVKSLFVGPDHMVLHNTSKFLAVATPLAVVLGPSFLNAPIDLALLPIGAYDPRDFMGPVHVDPEEAVRIHRDVGAVRSVGMHWGTFRLTTEPMDEPPERLRAAVEAAGLAPEAFTTVPLGAVLRAPFR